MRFFLTFLAIAVLLLGSSCNIAPAAQEEPTPTPIPTTAVPSKPVYTVQRGDVALLMQFVGRVVPVISKTLSFQQDGRVKEVNVQGGDFVKAGQVLAILDGLDKYEEQKASDQFNVRRAEVLLEIAKLQLEQARARLPRYPTHPDYPTASAEVSIKESEVELAEINLDEARLKSQNLDEAIAGTQIVAPIDGKVLTMRSGLRGDTVSAFETVMVVGDVSALEVSADLETEKLAALSQQMRVVALPESHPGKEISGEIRQLPYPFGSGQDEDGDTSLRIRLDIDLVKEGFTLGDRLQITAILNKKENALWLPPQAIRTFEGRTFVIVQDSEVQRRVDVKTGIRSSDRVEILEGLSEGQVVVSP